MSAWRVITARNRLMWSIVGAAPWWTATAVGGVSLALAWAITLTTGDPLAGLLAIALTVVWGVTVWLALVTRRWRLERLEALEALRRAERR